MTSDLPHRTSSTIDFDRFPGAEFVQKGVADVSAGRNTVEAALALMARSKFVAAGYTAPAPSFPEPAGHRLYGLLSDQDRATAHGRYIALVGRLTSFLDAVDHAPAR